MIDIESILTAIEGENPAGENLRYTPTYDEIQEARREDDQLDRGEWDRDVKTADWEAVKQLAVEALTEKTKDIQIAVWLLEALIKTDGFQGLDLGLQLLSGLMENFWENVYPEIEDDDLDYRIGPLEFMNEKLWLPVKQIPLTDSTAGNPYSWIQWKEATEAGNDEAAIAEGKLGIEEFEKAVTRSSKAFYQGLNDQIEQCIEAFNHYDNLLDEKFGSEAPRTADFKQSMEDCQRFIAKTLKQKKELDPDPEPEQAAGDAVPQETPGAEETESPAAGGETSPVAPASAAVQGQIVVGMISDTEPHEAAVWNSALNALQSQGIKKALDILFSASCSVSSVRSKNRYRLLMAKLCLQAERPDLARPIAEELNTLLEELGLERWESPVWVGDVLGALYRCLIQEEEGSEDYYRAEEIFKKMCTIDLTRALQHRR